MNVWFLLSAPAWLVLSITAAVRLANIDTYALRDHARRIGLVLVGTIALAMLLAPFTADWWRYSHASWETAVCAWAWALVWLTTPGMPPWYDMVLGVHRQTAEWKALGWRARIRGELQALRDSFRLTRHRT